MYKCTAAVDALPLAAQIEMKRIVDDLAQVDSYSDEHYEKDNPEAMRDEEAHSLLMGHFVSEEDAEDLIKRAFLAGYEAKK